MRKKGNKLPNTRLEMLRKEFQKKYGVKAWTQEAVAKKVGATPKSYRTWEKGGHLPETYYLIKLAQLFHVSCDYLLEVSDYTHIGNEEISKATGLTNGSIDFLRYLNYDGDRYKKDNVDRVNRQTISFLNRVLEEEGRKAAFDTDGDTIEMPTIFLSMERYVLSKNAVASIGGQSGQLITFDDVGAPLIGTIGPIYQEALIQMIRKQLDYFKDTAEMEGKNG